MNSKLCQDSVTAESQIKNIPEQTTRRRKCIASCARVVLPQKHRQNCCCSTSQGVADTNLKEVINKEFKTVIFWITFIKSEILHSLLTYSQINETIICSHQRKAIGPSQRSPVKGPVQQALIHELPVDVLGSLDHSLKLSI